MREELSQLSTEDKKTTSQLLLLSPNPKRIFPGHCYLQEFQTAHDKKRRAGVF